MRSTIKGKKRAPCLQCIDAYTDSNTVELRTGRTEREYTSPAVLLRSKQRSKVKQASLALGVCTTTCSFGPADKTRGDTCTVDLFRLKDDY